MSTTFEKVQAQVEQFTTPPEGNTEAARQAQDARLFAAVGVQEYLTAQAEAMRTAGFRARAYAQTMGVMNHELEWHPAAKGEDAALARATFNIASTGDMQVRFLAHLVYVNDEGQETQTFLSANYLDRALLERWFAAFVDLCLTARLSRGTA